MDKILIRNLRVTTIIGILERERRIPQDVVINLIAFYQQRPSEAQDEISMCVDYSSLEQDIRSLVKAQHRFTLEALAEDIASLSLQNPRVQKVIIRVEKPDALQGADSAGVEIERP